MEGDSEAKKENRKNPFLRHFSTIIISILLIVCGFLAGFYWHQSSEKGAVQVTLAQNNAPETQKEGNNQEQGTEKAPSQAQNCAFIASKKGTKYHAGQTHVAKQIKPENLLCFTSKEEAEAAGLTPGILE